MKGLNIQALDEVIENIAQRGCLEVHQILIKLNSGTPPHFLVDFSEQEREYIHDELKSVMDVYEGSICSL